jgi:hypothetical protein
MLVKCGVWVPLHTPEVKGEMVVESSFVLLFDILREWQGFELHLSVRGFHDGDLSGSIGQPGVSNESQT